MFIKIEKHRLNTEKIVSYYFVGGVTTVLMHTSLTNGIFTFQGDYTARIDALLKAETIQPTEQSDDK